ncbi:MAG: 1-acyl-sn-glycerol-3-phosphate acyltransferase [Ferruginibacter sp.]
MLYRLLYIPAQFALWIYCRNLRINNKKLLSHPGPLLIAANHPNSFLDAIIVSTLFKKPVYSLARGDAFTKPFYRKLLMSLNMFPVYRISEGNENLENNYETFESCRKLFKENCIVLIFSEGRCINEWKLRPLKKGTARLALSSWQEGIPLEIVPLGINYQSFTSFGKNVELNFGNIITEKDINAEDAFGKKVNDFNEKLRYSLQSLVFTAEKHDRDAIEKKFHVLQSSAKKVLLSIPAFTGYLLHAPLYLPIRRLSVKRALHNDHYDSVMVGLLFLLYPIYLLLASLLVYYLLGSYWWLLCFILLPFTAWSFVQVKKQF